MPDNDSPDFAQRFSDAIVSEIKAEMGRQGMSSRALARAIGANAQFVSSRLDGGNPRTGERVILNVRDLAAIAAALNIRDYDLVARAEAVASGEIVVGRFGSVRGPREDLAEVAAETDVPHEEDHDDYDA